MCEKLHCYKPLSQMKGIEHWRSRWAEAHRAAVWIVDRRQRRFKMLLLMIQTEAVCLGSVWIWWQETGVMRKGWWCHLFSCRHLSQSVIGWMVQPLGAQGSEAEQAPPPTHLERKHIKDLFEPIIKRFVIWWFRYLLLLFPVSKRWNIKLN